MKRKGKSTFFIVAVLIFALAYTAFFGVRTQYGDVFTTRIKGASDIRFGIDIRGGVDVTFSPADEYKANESQLASVEEIIKVRLVNLAITDYEIYTDTDAGRIILRFPWKEGESDFDPEAAIAEIGATALLTFHEGYITDAFGIDLQGDTLILEGADVKQATAIVQKSETGGADSYAVQLELNDSGKDKFATATAGLAGNGYITTIMDRTPISQAYVEEAIPDGVALISGNFTADQAVALANKINSGALPFALSAESYSTISPTLGAGALRIMVMAGIIAFILVCIYMVFLYRLPGAVACLALVGQVAATIAAISGYFPPFNSFTLTLPGIAGIILSIGMAVDANIITAERIREEIQKGKSLDGSIKAGFARGLTPIIDGNITVIIVAIVLMGAFGPTDTLFAKLLKPLFFAFGMSTAGMVYSFGYTLLVGVILNFIMGVGASRLMLRSLSKQEGLRSPKLYGYRENPRPAKDYDFVGNRKKFLAASGIVLAAIAAVSIFAGVKLDIEFKGGSMVSYSYTGTVDEGTLSSIAGDTLGGAVTVQTGNALTGEGTTVTITRAGSENLTTGEAQALQAALETEFPDNGFTQLEISNVSPSMGRSFLIKSAVGILAAALLILIYIIIRFKDIGGLPGGTIAIIALLHDLCIVFGVYVLLRIPLNGNFVAALLTILGYSINDTVVVYDRVRENKGLYGKKLSFPELMNLSINQSKVRSLRTTISTAIPLTAIVVVTLMSGLPDIGFFALALLLGMASGVYSSVCVAGPLWAWWASRSQEKK